MNPGQLRTCLTLNPHEPVLVSRGVAWGIMRMPCSQVLAGPGAGVRMTHRSSLTYQQVAFPKVIPLAGVSQAFSNQPD